MITSFIILGVSTFFFINGKIRSDIVAMCSLLSLVLFNILTPEEALSGFSNNIVIMMVGLFVVGGGIFQTGLAKMIGSRILELAGKSQLKLFILIMLVTAGIGAFVSNTGTVALMLPIVVSMAVAANIDPGRFLMPLAFASSMGGMMTLIGTPPNLVIQNVLVSAGYEPLSFFSFTPVGLICIAIGIVALIPLSKIFLSKKENKENESKKKNGKTQKELVQEYQLLHNLFRMQVTGQSHFNGKTLQKLQIPQKYGISVLEIRRKPANQRSFFKTIDQTTAGPETVIQKEDILYVLGEFDKVEKFAEENHLKMVDYHVTENIDEIPDNLNFHQIGISEILLMPNSKLINTPVKDSGFRQKFNVNVLGIQRGGKYLLNNVKDEKLHSGDAILIQGTWDNIARMSTDQSEWVVLGQPRAEAAKVTLDHKAPLAAGIMILMIVAMMFDIVPSVIAVLVASILMILTGCLRNVEDAYRTINWESIVLIAAMLPMSMALEKTGASAMISEKLVSSLGEMGPLALLAGIYFTTSLLTMVISNTATAVLLAPIALQSANGIGVSPYPFLFAVTVAASMCFASPFSTPPNALVMSAGKYRFTDYVKVGLPLQVVMGIIMILVLPLLFPF
ncbi:SLC13 family permease [Coprobacter tertius]|uniref:SLC13 family permease n=1 Tax=Coprobacter tertius TaxID=2944915 RepID=A0ABT1MIA6_9BACT|nr:SLC13 family permease [Coprobacter tertius]MCP9611784.1 SLC13 family permease [Coprobacter tertius]